MSRNATSDLELSVDCYATFERISAYVPWLTFNSTTRPTKKQVLTVFTRDSFDVMNGILAEMGYVTPVPSSVNSTTSGTLGKIHAMDVAAQVDIATRGGNAQVSAQGAALQEQRNLLWQSFQRGQIAITDATREGAYRLRPAEQKPQSRFFVVGGDEQDPVFTRDKKF